MSYSPPHWTRLFILLVAFSSFFGCQSDVADNAEASNIISGMLDGALASRQQVIDASGGVIESYKVYREGTLGLTYEYQLAEGVSPQVETEQLKMMLAEQLRKEVGRSDMKRWADLKIYFRWLYTSPSGETIRDAKVTMQEIYDLSVE